MFFGSQILIFYSVEFFAALNNTCISDSTLLLWLIARADGYVATRLMCRLICNLPELSIRISPCRRICTNKTNVPADLQSAGIEYKDLQSDCFILLFNRYELRITDPYIFRCAQQHVHIRQYITLVAYSPDGEHYPCGPRQRYAATRPNNSGTYSKKLTDMT